MQNLVKKIEGHIDEFSKNADLQVNKGNKAAGTRARKAALELSKSLKDFRKMSVENNILINNTFHPHVWFADSGDVFTRNIVMTPYRPINLHGWGGEVDYNIFTGRTALDAARERDIDHHSIVYPVRFENPEQGDYRVTGSAVPVFRIGFQNFEMDRFGVVSPRLRELARTPQMSLPVDSSDDGAIEVVVNVG